MMSNTKPPAVRRAVRPIRIVLSAFALLIGVVTAQPVLAQFAANEGFTDSGTPHWTFEAQPYLWLPATSAKIGLGDARGVEISGTVRPTLSQVVNSLNAAITCDCIVRYGNWSAELNLSYISLASSKRIAPILPMGPSRQLDGSISTLLVSPGFGYRVLDTHGTSNVSLDVRAGFAYSQVNASAGIVGLPATQVKLSTDFIQPWIGERVDYYPTPRWRLENTFALTGLGVDGGAIGWNTHVGVSYLLTKWFDVSAGYAAEQTLRTKSFGLRGEDNSVNILEYGPYVAMGFRF